MMGSEPGKDDMMNRCRDRMVWLGLMGMLGWCWCTGGDWKIALGDQRPNIVLMLADDQGWNGTSVAMHPTEASSRGKEYHTPNLEQMAARGMRFSQAYAPAPVCSPTRISLQTGQSPAQLHWTKAAPAVEGMRMREPKLIKNLASEEVTIAEMLRKAGYRTAHFGKWHIGGGGPGRNGYDVHDGDTGNEHAFRFHDPNPVDIFGMAARAREFMAESQAAGKPFYLQLSWNALHASENASKKALAKYQQQMQGASEKRVAVAAMTEDLDRGIGEVMRAIEELGLETSTYVIYMSDNGAGGGGGKQSGLRGGKGGVWEGGIRVPMIVQGPGVAANGWCHEPVVGYDWFPTFCEWAGIGREHLPSKLEGGSLHELLTQGGQGKVERRHPGLVFHFPHYQSEGPQSSIRVGSMKLIHFYEEDRDALYDLSRDTGERRDLSAESPELVLEMRRQLEAYLDGVGAQRPVANTNFVPAAKEAGSGGQQGAGQQAGRGARKRRTKK